MTTQEDRWRAIEQAAREIQIMREHAMAKADTEPSEEEWESAWSALRDALAQQAGGESELVRVARRAAEYVDSHFGTQMFTEKAIQHATGAAGEVERTRDVFMRAVIAFRRHLATGAPDPTTIRYKPWHDERIRLDELSRRAFDDFIAAEEGA